MGKGKGERGKRTNSNYQLPITHYQCPMPNALCPIPVIILTNNQ
ncbi:hypothetical protein FDUTEX481_01150 [Tolypothrix sp. PCC 7601]|nr:hypothetical protein FDUTEX481_01150 [Tolypothrix sp. PCC 7601]